MAIPNSIDPKSGYCSETKIYHSLRPRTPLPPQTTPVSITDFIFSLLLQRQTTTTTTSSAAALIDAATGQRIPYPELILRVKSLAVSLRDRIGLSRGDSAFILSPNSVHVPILYLSLFSLGVIVSPSNPTSSKPEISRQIDLCKPVIAFATSDAAHKVPSLRHRPILLDSPEFESMMMTCQAENSENVVVWQSDPAAILYSSGTAGKFKGVMLSHRNFIALFTGVLMPGQVRSSPAVDLCAVPYFHVYGFTYSIRAIMMGESVVSMGRFDLRLMMRAIEEFRVTHVALAPPVVVAMVRDGGDVMDGGYNLGSLEVVACGGAPLANPVIHRFKERFPNVILVQGYGMTETTGGITRIVGPEESRILGATGRLTAHSQAKIVDPDTGTGLPPFKRGEFWVRGPCIMNGYAGDKEATEAVLDSEGWLRSGDLCYFDSEGYLFFVERIKELIKYKGYQVAPAELEHLLHSHPDIDEAAVIPYPDEEAGQIPMAFVVRRSGSTTDESQIIDFVAKQVAPYKKIRRVAFANSLPKNASGKLLRKELIKLALSSASSKL